MRRLLAVAALALGLSLAAGAVRAQEPEHPVATGKTSGDEMGGELPEHGETPEIHPKSLALQLLNFAVLIVVLVKFGGPAINKALSARHQQLKADLAAAETARAEAEARLARHEARLAKLEQEIADIQSGVKQEAEAEKARLIALAEERAKRIREETAFALDQQVKEAEGNLRREVALAAVQVAEQLVRQSMNTGDQQRMVETFVSDVAAKPAAPARSVG
ncbi:MAG TPA: ATP synthase F0 subunit B [Polyangia bacterium]|nr:ATP synthase F0 subunit B [Polyangia bacterium]